jgi:hypothetical protein
MNVSTAIAKEEGFFTQGTRPQRNNNPGDIEFGFLTRKYGATKGDPRFAVFPSLDEGWNCLECLLRYDYKGLTISQAINKFAPGNENDTAQYIKNVCLWTGLTPETVIDAYI